MFLFIFFSKEDISIQRKQLLYSKQEELDRPLQWSLWPPWEQNPEFLLHIGAYKVAFQKAHKNAQKCTPRVYTEAEPFKGAINVRSLKLQPFEPLLFFRALTLIQLLTNHTVSTLIRPFKLQVDHTRLKRRQGREGAESP